MGIFDKIKEVVSEHPDQVSEGIDRAGDFLDEKTGGKYAEQVDQGQDFLKGQAGNLGPRDLAQPEHGTDEHGHGNLGPSDLVQDETAANEQHHQA